MKKIYFILIVLILVFSTCFAVDFRISVSPQKVKINGIQTQFEVYNINGNNFFKLRDIAYVLNKTASQFSVLYNSEKALIETQTGLEYVPDGTEMKLGVDNSGSAKKSSQKIAINGVEKDLLAYNIAGNNFFKLRDLGEALNFIVDYDQENNTVIVKSNDPIVPISKVNAGFINGTACVEIHSNSSLNNYSVFPLFEEESNRIVFDVPNSRLTFDNPLIEAEYGDLVRIRIGNQGNDVFRFVLDLKQESKYVVAQSQDKLITYIALADSFNVPGNTQASSVTSGENEPVIDVIESGENIIIDSNESVENTQPKYSEEELSNRITIMNLKYSSTKNKVTLSSDGKLKFKESKEGNNISFDIENAVINMDGDTEISPVNKALKKVMLSQTDEMHVNLLLETNAKMDYEVNSTSSSLEIFLDEPTYQNLEYTSTSSGGKITLLDVDKEVFTTKYDSKTDKYTIKYSESRFSCGEETLTVKDDWVSTIKISTGKIVIQGEDAVSFSMEQVGKNVVVTVGKPTSAQSTTPIQLPSNDNVVSRSSSFTVQRLTASRFLVGRVYVNDTSGVEFDINQLKKKSSLAINDKSNVLIYHTHTSEGYVESGINANFHTTNNNLNVVAVGDALANYLGKKGINAYHDITRNDTSYNDAYDASLESVQKILNKKSYDILIDLHRDAVSSDYYYGPKTTINGEPCAKLMFVMGSTGYGLEHPNWIENLKFALLIQNKAEEMYPGLFRDMSLVKYRYNQHLANGAILMEVGATGNTMQEVENSMKYLANVLATLDK